MRMVVGHDSRISVSEDVGRADTFIQATLSLNIDWTFVLQRAIGDKRVGAFDILLNFPSVLCVSAVDESTRCEGYCCRRAA